MKGMNFHHKFMTFKYATLLFTEIARIKRFYYSQLLNQMGGVHVPSHSFMLFNTEMRHKLKLMKHYEELNLSAE